MRVAKRVAQALRVQRQRVKVVQVGCQFAKAGQASGRRIDDGNPFELPVLAQETFHPVQCVNAALKEQQTGEKDATAQ